MRASEARRVIGVRRAITPWLLGAVVLTPGLAWWAATLGGYRLVLNDLPSAAVALLLAPLVEEWVLRTGLQQGLLRAFTQRSWVTAKAEAMSVLLCTLVFALIHLDQFTWGAVLRCAPWLAPGSVLALAWCWRRRLSDCVLLHFYFNIALAWASWS